MKNEKDYLKSVAQLVGEQAADDPLVGVPVDTDVADFMGAFTEDALTLDDLMDDVLLHVNEQGEVFYGK